VQLHQVVRDDKGPLLASRRFTVQNAAMLPADTVTEAARWIASELAARFPLDRPPTTVTLRVPADPGRERIRVDGAQAAVEVYLVEAGRKLRVPATPELLGTLQRDFDLEVVVPGAGSRVIRVVRGRAVEQSFTIGPATLPVGIEDFGGDPTVAVRLTDALSADRRLLIRPPSALAQLRREIAENQALLARNPMVQMSLRSQLGIDVLVSGQLEER
jgi:hypothetical protein